jgi:hypothetical protein
MNDDRCGGANHSAVPNRKRKEKAMNISYTRGQRKAARNDKMGLMTLSYTAPDGMTVTRQCLVRGAKGFEAKAAEFVRMITKEEESN